MLKQLEILRFFFHCKLIVIVCKFNFSCCSFLSDNFLNNSLDNTSFLIYSKVVYLWVKLPGINSKTRFFSTSRALFLPCYCYFYIPLAIWATTLWSRFPWECSGTCFDSCLCKYPQYFVSVPMMMWVFINTSIHVTTFTLSPYGWNGASTLWIFVDFQYRKISRQCLHSCLSIIWLPLYLV